MRFQMDDGSIVNTKNAVKHWDEDTFHDGHNHISVATGSQWNHQTLYKSRKGRYYIVSTSQWQGSRDHCEWVSNHEAARWLLANNEALPDDLAQLEAEIVE